MALRRFLYLDQSALNDYVSSLEDGLREALRRQTSGSVPAESGLTDPLREEEVTMSDTPHARFERLLRLVKADPENAGWVDLGDQGSDFEIVGSGALIKFDCDVYIPDTIRLLSPSGGMIEALDQLDALLPSAQVLGLDGLEDLPSRQERNAVKSFMQMFGGNLVFVGDDDNSNWSVAGQLSAEYIQGDIDGRASVVGKVAATWREGEWRPLLALPGSSLLPRKQRRALAKKRPSEEEEDQFLEGPALMLDVLAIYR